MTTRACGWTLAGLVGLAMPAAGQSGVYASVDAGRIQPVSSVVVQRADWPARFEEASLETRYRLGRAPSLDIRAGVVTRLAPALGVGLGLGLSQMAAPVEAAVTLSLPHPILFDVPASGRTTVGVGDRRERAVHLEVSARLGLGPLLITGFAGPSRVRLRQSLVTRPIFTDRLVLSAAMPYTVALTAVESREVETWAWGYTAGVDIGVFPTRRVGFGAIVRQIRADARVPNVAQSAVEPDTAPHQTMTLGGVTAGGGLRVRF